MKNVNTLPAFDSFHSLRMTTQVYHLPQKSRSDSNFKQSAKSMRPL